jgi:DNA-binding NarL/FixJ family response regulator
VAEASDSAEALRQVAKLRPEGLDVVLMDINLSGTDGIEATEEITRNDPDLPVIMLTVSTLDRDLFEAVRVGAVGYLSKALPANAIASALRDFHEHEALPMSAVMATRVLRYFQSRGAQAWSGDATSMGLSPREQDVLRLLARGQRDREIATALDLSEGTVKKHVQNILRKLQARNRAEAIALVHRQNRRRN